MAEGFLKHLAGEQFEVFSAGLNPVSISLWAIQVMKEAGIDISRQYSKSVDEFTGRRFDFVITVCDNARQNCPFFPGDYQQIHWNVEDPAFAQGSTEEIIDSFRKTRDTIQRYVSGFLQQQTTG